MSGILLNSPADIVRNLLITLGLGANPPSSSWPIYHKSEPDTPDNVITVFDTEGRNDGRMNPTLQRMYHHGIQIRVRSGTHNPGYIKANAIAIAIDENVYRETVTIAGVAYCVHCIIRTSDVIPLGKETPISKRDLFVINAILAVRKITP